MRRSYILHLRDDTKCGIYYTMAKNGSRKRRCPIIDDKLGGRARVAQLLIDRGFYESGFVVTRWYDRGRMSSLGRLAIEAIADELGISYTAEDFRFSRNDAANAA